MDKRERNDIFRVLDEETLKNSKKDVRSRSFFFRSGFSGPQDR